MYVVTFYSFKGGVGRTLALANVGVELARTGRRVLLVDFDLEAPGLDTFDRLRPREPHKGIVEYVTDFTASHVAPDAREFVYELPELGAKDGRLWVMPAGSRDAEYAGKLGRIDWQELYDAHDGFLMFEDLKAQWEASFAPDYVLIDSRTGHTDVGGICTRQLPHAVVVLYFPNEQNLSGLRPVVSSIRAESDLREEGDIKLHFVMSNVPDLDDEQEILSGMQERFRADLKYEELISIIHRYDSLSLLRQSMFILERPKSRLAKEYRSLVNHITEYNNQDAEAVKRRLTMRPLRRMSARRGSESTQKFVDDVLRYHSDNGEIVYMLAMDLKRRGRLEEYQMLLARSIELGYRSPQAFLAQGEVALQTEGEDSSKLVSNVMEAFKFEGLDEDELTQGVEILRRAAPDKLREVTSAPAFRSLSPYQCSLVADEFMSCVEGLKGAVDLLVSCIGDAKTDGMAHRSVRRSLSLALIGLGRFQEAINLFGGSRPEPEALQIDDCFNYAIAEWGDRGKLPRDLFERVVELHSKNPVPYGPNYHQCLAIACCAIGAREDARRHIEQAITLIEEGPRPEFSCWRYMRVPPGEFKDDCAEIKELIAGDAIRPRFLLHRGALPHAGEPSSRSG